MIRDNVKRLLAELPQGVELVAAAKTRTVSEIQEAIASGVKIIGQNYVQEAQGAFSVIGCQVKWHLIGHLQKNKVKKAVKIFDLIETVDSLKLAEEISRSCQQENKIMPVLVEINSASEAQKFGVRPEDAEALIRQIAQLDQIKVMGLMTMGPDCANPEEVRPYFIAAKEIFSRLAKLHIPRVEMRWLSMGMSNSYQLAIQEGANLVRIGSKIFGERTPR